MSAQQWNYLFQIIFNNKIFYKNLFFDLFVYYPKINKISETNPKRLIKHPDKDIIIDCDMLLI